MILAKQIVILSFFAFIGQVNAFFSPEKEVHHLEVFVESDSLPENEEAPLPQLVSNMTGDEEENHQVKGPEVILPEFSLPVSIHPVSMYLALSDRRERPPEQG